MTLSLESQSIWCLLSLGTCVSVKTTALTDHEDYCNESLHSIEAMAFDVSY